MESQRERIIAYYNQLDRSRFIDGHNPVIKWDLPLPIGYGQTISQPSLVLEMTLALDLHPDARVLEIGTGSGYQTALLAAFSQEVYTVENLQPLYDKARQRLEKEGFFNIFFKHGDGSNGWADHSPYDRIMVTASASRIPDELLRQLAIGGKMIIPVGHAATQQLQIVEKGKNGELTTSNLVDVAFVRLKGKYE